MGGLKQASTPLPDPRRGPAPPPHPVFVQGAGGHCIRAGNGGPGNPPPPRSGPLGKSKKISGVYWGSPAFSFPERPGGGLPEVRWQIGGSFLLPASLIETLSPIEKSLQGFGNLPQGWYLNRPEWRRKKKERKTVSLQQPPPGEFSWLPVGGGEPRGVRERGGWAPGWLEAAGAERSGGPGSRQWRSKPARGLVPERRNSCVAFWAPSLPGRMIPPAGAVCFASRREAG